MRTFLFTFSFLLLSSFSFAATTTWNGGFGFWHQAGNWDTGQVPGEDDEVIITSGFVVIASNTQAKAEQVTVNLGSTLGIDINGALRIADEYGIVGITNSGNILVLGTIELENLQNGFSSITPRGILNERFLKVFNGGSIVASNIKNTTITNDINATFINEGSISLSLQNTAWITGINNLGRFDNNLTGIIHQKGGYAAFANTPSANHFHNRGKVIIESTLAAGFSNQSFARNFSTGSITFYKSSFTNNYISADFRNEGSMSIYKSANYPAIYNHNIFKNDGWISIQDCYSGINSHSPNSSYSPVFENTSYLSIIGCTSEAITNEHDFINSTDGYIIVDSRISTYNSGLYTNNGIFKAQISNNYFPNFINNGILEDTYGKFIMNLTNNKVVVRPIPGPIFAGQSISPALGIVSFSGMSFGQWQDDLGGDVCGSFSLASNTLQPNMFAQDDDDSSLWVHLGIAGNTDWFEVRVSNNSPLQTTTGNSISDINLITGKNTQNSPSLVSVSTYPNPTRGTLNFDVNSALQEAPIQVTVRNASGQDSAPSFVLNSSEKQSIQLPAHLPDGVYFLEFRSANQVLKIEQIILSK